MPSPAPAGKTGVGTVSGGGSVGGGVVVGHGGGGNVVVEVVVVWPGGVVVVVVVVVVAGTPGRVVVVLVVVAITGTQGRVSTGGLAVVVVVVVVDVVVVDGSDVVDSGTVVVVVVGVGSVLGGGVPARTECWDSISGATTTIVANTARAADEERRGLDIARIAAGSPGLRPPHDKLSVALGNGLIYLAFRLLEQVPDAGDSPSVPAV
jgi:hypothetical protein